MPEVIGIDHIYITVSELERSKLFYDKVMKVLEFKTSEFKIKKENHIQYYNRYFSYVLRPSHSNVEHNSFAVGLHHICMRVHNKDDVQKAAKDLTEIGIEVSEPKLYSEYAHDYYAFFFKDPDGIELEITNYRQERRERYENWV